MSDDHDQSIARAFAAVQQNVLPGLGIAWDKSGPEALLVAEYAICRLWIENGFPLNDLLAMAQTALPPSLPAKLIKPA
jgi:hypothetical protein